MGDAVTRVISIAIALLCLCNIAPAQNQQSWGSVGLMLAQASTSTEPGDILKFTFEYANHPTSITLNSVYSAPANSNAALYDSGDGVWRPFTSRTIPVLASSNYVSFKGDWRRSNGTYYYMFESAFTVTNSRCRTSGRLAYAPTNNANAYAGVFSGCTRITSFDDNPFQTITGSPGASMFYVVCYGMTGLTNLPAGFMNTSGLTGAPAASMFYQSFQNVSGVKNLPAGYMNTSGLTGAPAASMFNQACYGMTGVTNLPVGFLNTSGLTGAPAASMFFAACQNMSSVTNLPVGFLNTSGLTGAPAASMFYAACQSMSSVTKLPDGFLDTRGLTGAPAADMFRSACQSMSSVTNLPDGFLDTSGLSGAPAANMFYQTCYLMSGVLAGNFNMSSNITFASNNIVSTMPSACNGMTKWTGTMYWGTNRIYDAIPNPSFDSNVFKDSTNVPGYTTMGSNWK
jgi:hypothetical protein